MAFSYLLLGWENLRASTHLLLLKMINEYSKIAKAHGFLLRFGADFHWFKQIPNFQNQRAHVHPAFDVDHCNLNETNAFWMVGYSKQGEIIATQAMKKLDLCNETLPQHFADNVFNFSSYGHDYDFNKTSWRLTKAASEITGNVAYHGELWLKKNSEHPRASCTSTILSRLMLLMALSRWPVDFFIGLQTPQHSLRGLSIKEGYVHLEQGGFNWVLKNQPTPTEEWMVWMSREEAIFNLNQSGYKFINLLDKKEVNSDIQKYAS